MKFPESESIFNSLGAIDIVLNADTPLFIDPMLLQKAESKLWSQQGLDSYNKFFEQAIKLLFVVKQRNAKDIAWKTLSKKFLFREINFTCLGYGGGKGSGWGPELVNKTLNTAKDIVELGVEDVDLFMALALFEDGIGPDRISDMVTNIIFDQILEYTVDIVNKLNIKTEEFIFNDQSFSLIRNPYSNNPIFFVPMDVVRDLPIATDWSEISEVVKKNEQLRRKINENVGLIWANMTKKDKAEFKSSALQDKESFDNVLDLVKKLKDLEAYNFKKDPNGDIFWLRVLKEIASEYPLNLKKFSQGIKSKEQLLYVVKQIIEQFRILIEDNGLWKELWTEEEKPRKEKACQRLLFAIAISYCKANDLDLSPEVDSGNGPVDFKISQGFNFKVIVEIKLSTNTNVVHGYQKQLEIYKKAEESEEGIFILIDIGGIGDKFKKLQEVRRDFFESNGKASEIFLIDGNPKASASKRK